MTAPLAAPPDRAKRALDLVVAVPALVVLSPVLLAIALTVRWTAVARRSSGRSGWAWGGGVPAAQVPHHASQPRRSPREPRRRQPRHPRRPGPATHQARPLPQAIDVAAGRMSLVGPRPEVPRYAALWDPAQAQVILSVRPGITDPVSIAFRHEADLLAAAADPESHYREVLLPQKAAMYVDYVQRRTLLGDLRILLQTVAAVVRD